MKYLGYKIFSIIAFLFGCIGLVSVVALDKLYWSTWVFEEGWPKFSLYYSFRSFIIFASILAIVKSSLGFAKPRLILDESNGVPLERLSIFGMLLVSVIIVFLFVFRPSVFNELSWEDGPVEWASALLLFVGCIVIIVSLFKSRNILNIPKFTQFSLALLSLLFFVTAMEEVSWFQRWLEIETPKAFDDNYQREINFHNFATNEVENIYYFGVFLFLVALPYVRSMFPFVSNNNYLRIFVPRPFVSVIGSIPCAYNFDMWNVVFTQIAFFSSVIILLAYVVFSSKRSDINTILFAIFVIVATQILFLTNGENFDPLWAVTEYKELLIPMVLLIYSLNVLTYINRVGLPEK